MFTQKYLKECFDYDPEAGICTWKVRPRNHFESDRKHKSFNARKVGKCLGTINGKGYLTITLNRKKDYIHRLIFIWLGKDVKGLQVDHINGDKLDNRLENIRLVTQQENLRNKRLRKSNKSGVSGVRYCEDLISKPWKVTYYENKKCIELFFSTLLDAACERIKFEQRNNYHANHGRA